MDASKMGIGTRNFSLLNPIKIPIKLSGGKREKP